MKLFYSKDLLDDVVEMVRVFLVQYFAHQTEQKKLALALNSLEHIPAFLSRVDVPIVLDLLIDMTYHLVALWSRGVMAEVPADDFYLIFNMIEHLEKVLLEFEYYSQS